MNYEELKKSISDEISKKIQITGNISVLNKRIQEFSNIKDYIVHNKESYGAFSFPKSEPDSIEKQYKISKRIADGSWIDNDKSTDVTLLLKMKDKSNKYKYYDIEKIVDDGGLEKHLKSQIPLIEQKIKSEEKELHNIDLKISELKSAFDKTENPNIQRHKKNLSMLEEASRSAISSSHKEKINKVISAILNDGQWNYDDISRAWYLGAKQFVTGIVKRLGGKLYHKSEKNATGSVYYNLPNTESVRISDHELPETETRMANREKGWGGKWIEIVLDNPVPFSDLKKEVLEKLKEQIGTGDGGREVFLNQTNEIKEKIEKLLSEKEFGGELNIKMKKSVDCKHSPTKKGTKCANKTLNSIGKCHLHI